jgi:hypothetical protein
MITIHDDDDITGTVLIDGVEVGGWQNARPSHGRESLCISRTDFARIVAMANEAERLRAWIDKRLAWDDKTRERIAKGGMP